jgi:two-component system, chemotaxis family, protein-glutamate methylesterase/glutaminase
MSGGVHTRTLDRVTRRDCGAGLGGFGLVVLAASAGGLKALGTVLAALPETFPVPVLALQHRSEGTTDLLPGLLSARSALPVRAAAPGPLAAGVSVLPPGTSGELDAAGRLAVVPHPTLGSADHLLASAAAAFGPRVLTVVLTGRLSDGAAGVRAVKRAGGRVLAQDPADAQAPGMPSAALATGCVEHVLPLRLIGPALTAYTMAPGAAELFAVPVAPWARLGAAPAMPA